MWNEPRIEICENSINLQGFFQNTALAKDDNNMCSLKAGPLEGSKIWECQYWLGGHFNLSFLVEIELSDIPISGGRWHPTAPTGLKSMCAVLSRKNLAVVRSYFRTTNCQNVNGQNIFTFFIIVLLVKCEKEIGNCVSTCDAVTAPYITIPSDQLQYSYFVIGWNSFSVTLAYENMIMQKMFLAKNHS